VAPGAAKPAKPTTTAKRGRAATKQAKAPITEPKPARSARSRRSSASTRRALAHLSAADPVLAQLIDTLGPLPDARAGRPAADDHYGALVRSITGQQLSVFAARAIYGRLTERFGGRPPTPQEILADDPEALRTAAGLSRAKVSFLRSLAEHVLSGELELERLDQLPDEQVFEELVAVKGLGQWTVDMFLMFHLEREDVLPVGDLGIRRAFERLYGLDELPQPAQMVQIAEPWRPYRTLACRYLWRSLQNEPT
jgi:DNA-3-methyladenine glycosylase II